MSDKDKTVKINATIRYEGEDIDAVMQAMKDMQKLFDRKQKKAEFNDFVNGIQRSKHKRKKRKGNQ